MGESMPTGWSAVPGRASFKTPGGGGPPPSTETKETHEESESQRRPYSNATERVPPSIHSRFVFLCVLCASSEAGVNNMACGAHWECACRPDGRRSRGTQVLKLQAAEARRPPHNTHRKRLVRPAYRKGAALGERGPTYLRCIVQAILRAPGDHRGFSLSMIIAPD